MCKERFVNPFTDFGFKRLFGTEANKDILISFLNAILDDEDDIVEITYQNVEMLGQTEGNRKAVYDLYCTTEDGDHIIVEMQKAWQEHFIDRSIFYSARALDSAAKKGPWDFNLPKVYTICLLNFEPTEFVNNEAYKHVVRLCDLASGTVFSSKLTYIYLEMNKFHKELEKLESIFEKWMYVIKNLYLFDAYPSALKEKIFKKFFEEARISAFTPEEQFAYEESLKDMRDYNNTLASAEKKGRAEEKMDIARNMKADGEPFEKIVRYTGLTIQEIKNL